MEGIFITFFNLFNIITDFCECIVDLFAFQFVQELVSQSFRLKNECVINIEHATNVILLDNNYVPTYYNTGCFLYAVAAEDR